MMPLMIGDVDKSQADPGRELATGGGVGEAWWPQTATAFGGERQRVAVARALANDPLVSSPMSLRATWTTRRRRGFTTSSSACAMSASSRSCWSLTTAARRRADRILWLHDGQLNLYRSRRRSTRQSRDAVRQLRKERGGGPSDSDREQRDDDGASMPELCRGEGPGRGRCRRTCP